VNYLGDGLNDLGDGFKNIFGGGGGGKTITTYTVDGKNALGRIGGGGDDTAGNQQGVNEYIETGAGFDTVEFHPGNSDVDEVLDFDKGTDTIDLKIDYGFEGFQDIEFS